MYLLVILRITCRAGVGWCVESKISTHIKDHIKSGFPSDISVSYLVTILQQIRNKGLSSTQWNYLILNDSPHQHDKKC